MSGAIGFYTKDKKVRPITPPSGRPYGRVTHAQTQLNLDRFKDSKVIAKDGKLVIDRSHSLGERVGTNVETGEQISVPLAVRNQITVHPPDWSAAMRNSCFWTPLAERELASNLDEHDRHWRRLEEAAKVRRALSERGEPVLPIDLQMSSIEKDIYKVRTKIQGGDLQGPKKWVVRDPSLANRLAEMIAKNHGGAEITPLPDIAKQDGSIWGYLVWTRGYFSYMGG